MTTIRQLTEGAQGAETLSEAEYREIFLELRGKTSIRRFADFIGSGVSFGWWSGYEQGAKTLNRERRNELRRAAGLAELPLTIAEATAGVDPDAAVYQVGAATPNRVVLVGRDLARVTLHVNGQVTIADGATAAPEALVTGVTRARTGRRRGSIVLDRDTWERLNAARLRAGQTWEEFLAPLEPVRNGEQDGLSGRGGR